MIAALLEAAESGQTRNGERTITKSKMLAAAVSNATNKGMSLWAFVGNTGGRVHDTAER